MQYSARNLTAALYDTGADVFVAGSPPGAPPLQLRTAQARVDGFDTLEDAKATWNLRCLAGHRKPGLTLGQYTSSEEGLCTHRPSWLVCRTWPRRGCERLGGSREWFGLEGMDAHEGGAMPRVSSAQGGRDGRAPAGGGCGGRQLEQADSTEWESDSFCM